MRFPAEAEADKNLAVSPLVLLVPIQTKHGHPKTLMHTRLELEPQQQLIFFAWLVENKGTPKSKKAKRGANSGEA